VSLVQSEREVTQAAKEALAVSHSRNGLVEEYIEGTEISVEGFVADGTFHAICLSEKTRTPPPYLLDTAVYFPDTLSSSERVSVLSLASSAVAACGLDNCPVHMEILRSRQGPVVVELAARGAGFKVFTNILPYVTGIDTVDVQLRLALGEKAEIAAKDPLKGAVIVFLSPIAGKMKRIDGLDQARKIQGVQEAEIYLEPGAMMGQLKCGADRIGHLIVFGDNRQEAERYAAQAASVIKLEVE
jgi:biotin carboxylase